MKSFSNSVQAGIEFSAELFRKAKRAVVLTGAGISTPSGIPDFRSEGSGLWSRDEPLEVASMRTFRTHPEKFYAWFRPLARQIFEAVPNARIGRWPDWKSRATFIPCSHKTLICSIKKREQRM